MGIASPPSSQCTRALSSPATKWFGVARICTSGRGSTPRRSSSARRAATSSRSAPRSTHTRTSVAPMARAASSAPSSTRCGDDASRKRSLALAGSPSVPLTTTMGSPGTSSAARSLCTVGKPAPPRPRRPAASTSSTSERARPFGGERLLVRRPVRRERQRCARGVEHREQAGRALGARVGLVDLGTVGCGRAHDRLPVSRRAPGPPPHAPRPANLRREPRPSRAARARRPRRRRAPGRWRRAPASRARVGRCR